jgi:hypothetical protein
MMKDLDKTKSCLSQQLEHLPEGVPIHRSIKRVFKKFDRANATL